MPPRWLGVAIVVWWLAMMGWLFWHDLWPSWRPGEPPRFHIDLVEEVQHGSDRPKIYWNVYRQKKDEKEPTEIFRANSSVEYLQEDDTFALRAELKAKATNKDGTNFLPLLHFKVDLMRSEYHVNRAGQLRELQLKVNLSPLPHPEKAGERPEDAKGDLVRLELRGEVRDDQFFAHCRVVGTSDGEIDLPPVSVSHNASVLLPLHPVNRIRGLHPGQSWRQPLVDPLGGTLLAGGGVHYLNARVLPQLQVLKEEDGDEATCLVIEYEDEGQLVGRTWVERDSERVQQQETIHDGEHWTMKRDDPRKALKKHPAPHPSAGSRGLNHD